MEEKQLLLLDFLITIVGLFSYVFLTSFALKTELALALNQQAPGPHIPPPLICRLELLSEQLASGRRVVRIDMLDLIALVF